MMTKEEEAVIKLKITRQQPGNVQTQGMGVHCADRDGGGRYAMRLPLCSAYPGKRSTRLDSKRGQAGSRHLLSSQEHCWSPACDSKTVHSVA